MPTHMKVERRVDPQIHEEMLPVLPGGELLPVKSIEPKGNLIFTDTYEVNTPHFDEKKAQVTSSPLFDWMTSFFNVFNGSEAPKAESVNKTSSKPALPIRPELAPPAPEAREQMLKVLEATKQANRLTQLIQEETKDQPDGHIYKRTIALFKEIIQLNEQFIKSSMEDSKENSDTIQKLHGKLHELRDEIRSTQTQATIAKTTQTAINLFAIGTVAFVITGAAFATATGFVPAVLPAVMQAMSTTAYTTTLTLSSAAQATTQAMRTYLENVSEKSKSESSKHNHDHDNVYFEIKTSREDWKQFMQIISNLWSHLAQIDEKRRQSVKLHA